MWNTFRDILNRQAQNPAEQAVVIAAANETFLKFGQWFEKAKASPQPSPKEREQENKTVFP